MRRQGKKGAGLQPAPASTVGPQLQAVAEGALETVETTSHEVVFLVDVSPEVIQREKEKARVLRRSQWWQRRLARGECYYCHCKVPPQELTMDHIVPLARGGQSTRGNVAPACKSCNSRKKYLLPMEWDDYLRRLTSAISSRAADAAAAEQDKDDEGMQRV